MRDAYGTRFGVTAAMSYPGGIDPSVYLVDIEPGTEHSVSPSRSESFRRLISDWLDDPVTDAALALLPEWVRWNGEQAGIPGPLIEHAVSAASAG
jgi:hypothetical protein